MLQSSCEFVLKTLPYLLAVIRELVMWNPSRHGAKPGVINSKNSTHDADCAISQSPAHHLILEHKSLGSQILERRPNICCINCRGTGHAWLLELFMHLMYTI